MNSCLHITYWLQLDIHGRSYLISIVTSHTIASNGYIASPARSLACPDPTELRFVSLFSLPPHLTYFVPDDLQDFLLYVKNYFSPMWLGKIDCLRYIYEHELPESSWTSTSYFVYFLFSTSTDRKPSGNPPSSKGGCHRISPTWSSTRISGRSYFHCVHRTFRWCSRCLQQMSLREQPQT